MKKLISLLSVLMTVGIFSVAFAQQKVTGKIVDSRTSEPLVGVTVTNQKTKKATTTDAAGNFTIEAAAGDNVDITYVGFIKRTMKVPASGNFGNVTLVVSEASELDDVVVTSFGITRQKRSLGYVTQEVDGAEIAQTQRENFINSLQGRVAGATVNSTSGAPGASSQIVLRGFNSISGNNSPLFIIDGLPVNNSSFEQRFLASDKPNRDDDYSNRGIDINPDDIESVTILKGPEATALYGIDAGSGAIVITTRKGKAGKLKLSYDNNFRLESLRQYPDIQTEFGTGVNGQFDSSVRSRFGPRWPEDMKLYNNVENFFRTGFSQKHNLNMQGGTKSFTYRANMTWQDQMGVIPNTRYTRFIPRLTLDKTFSKKLKASTTLTYTHSKNDKASRGAGGFLSNLLLWPSFDDVTVWLDSAGNRRKVVEDDNFREVDNPFWDVNRNLNQDILDRYIANVSVVYDPLSWLNITARGGIDTYNQGGEYMVSPQSNAYLTVGGFAEKYDLFYRGISANLIATGRWKFGKLGATVRAGSAIDDFQTEAWSERAEDIGDIFNFELSTQPSKRQTSRDRGRDTLTQRRLFGVFGEIGLNYDDFLFVTATGRNDLSSTLPEESRSFFYPSISTSFVFSNLLPKSNIFSFGKLRASYAQAAKDIPPYVNQSVYTAQTTSGAGFAYGFRNNSPLIVPERQNTYEIGTELRFFKNRLSVDVTYYNTTNIGQIVTDYRGSYGTGFILNTGNIADTRNEGVEAMINFTAVETQNFRWDTRLNFARSWNEVTKLPPTVTEFYNSDSWIGNYRNGLLLNGPTTGITGATYLRNNAGDILIDPVTGLPQVDGTYRLIGDRLPTFTTGIVNTLNYKQWTLSFLLDVRVGGDILNGNELYWTTVGLSKRTLDRETPRVIAGVLADGLQNSATPTRNTIAINPYFYNDIYTNRALADDYMERDVNWLWCRDITLRYTVPSASLRNNKIFSNLSAFVTCTDLFVLTNYSGFNPNGNGNTPGTRGVGSFGIDFGTLPNPLGFNFGVAVGFKN